MEVLNFALIIRGNVLFQLPFGKRLKFVDHVLPLLSLVMFVTMLILYFGFHRAFESQPPSGEEIINFWLQLTWDVVPLLCVTLMIAFCMIIIFPKLRSILWAEKKDFKANLCLTVIFGSFVLFANHSSPIYDPSGKDWIKVEHNLFNTRENLINQIAINQKEKVSVGFRDTWVILSGLTGGIYVGGATCLISALNRFLIGNRNEIARASAIATLLLGALIGLIRFSLKDLSSLNARQMVIVMITGTLFQRVSLLFITDNKLDAWNIAVHIGIPVIFINVFGSVIFLIVMRLLELDRLENHNRELHLIAEQERLEKDRYKLDKERYETETLRLLTKPHRSLNPTIQKIRLCIGKDNETAKKHLNTLQNCFNAMNAHTKKSRVSLEAELKHVKDYLELNKLVYGKNLDYIIKVNLQLYKHQVFPFCLVTLVENALNHAFYKFSPPYHLAIEIDQTNTEIILKVCDNGRGLPPDRFDKICQTEVKPAKDGSGRTLYSLARSIQNEFGAQARIYPAQKSSPGSEFIIIFPKIIEELSHESKISGSIS